jgi:uncharacterized protein
VIVVSDTSPLTYLHQIEHFTLLRTLYDEVVIPPAVERELKEASRLHEHFDWSIVRVANPINSKMVDSLSATLDRGESEAIVVASEINADLLLIDEADGREVASKLGIRHTGLLGVLLEGKRRGAIPEVASLIDRLVGKTSFRVRPDVRREVLRLAGES